MSLGTILAGQPMISLRVRVRGAEKMALMQGDQQPWTSAKIVRNTTFNDRLHPHFAFLNGDISIDTSTSLSINHRTQNCLE